MNDFRIGYGYDVHRFADGRKLYIGGIEIPHDKGLLGHSDADVLLHAICDAMLGALALGDIGTHFPDTDDAYKNIDSKILIDNVYKLIRKEGYLISNTDSTIIAERPKMKVHIPAVRESIAKLLQTEIKNVSVKATTSEKMGFAGREEGIAVHSVVLLKPADG